MKLNGAQKKAFDRIIEIIENSGKLPWQKSYVGSGPVNGVTGKEYTGAFNHSILAFVGQEYGSQIFCGLRQGSNAGGKLRKGSRGTPIFSPVMFKKEVEENGKKESVYFHSGRFNVYYVFNQKQWEVEPKWSEIATKKVLDFTPIEACENFLGLHPEIEIKDGSGTPCYIPSKDEIRMPNREKFKSVEGWYRDLFHEVMHWTGHESRLNRLESTKFGSSEYSREELVAEMGAHFIAGECGLESESETRNTAAYLQGWMRRLKEDPTILMGAAGQAEKAIRWFKAETEAERNQIAGRKSRDEKMAEAA